jgi:hypothetical protein
MEGGTAVPPGVTGAGPGGGGAAGVVVVVPGIAFAGAGVVISAGGGAMLSGAGVPSSGVAGEAVSGAGEPSSGGVGVVGSEPSGAGVATMPGLTCPVPTKLLKLGGEIGTVKIPVGDGPSGACSSATPVSALPPGGGAPGVTVC